MPRQPNAPRGKPLPEWRTFEQAVAAIQKLLSPPNAVVTHDDQINDLTGSPRQFDVTIRGEWAGMPALGVIECKRKSRPVGKHEIEAFHAKAQSVNANFKVIVSRQGFYKDALKLARHYNVGAMSLLDQDSQTSFAFAGPCFARLHHWPQVWMALHFADGQTYEGAFDMKEVCYNGQPILGWFGKELSTTYLRYKDSDHLSCDLSFDKPAQFSIGTENRMVDSVRFVTKREIIKKTKLVKWSGDAFYDWREEKLIWPHGGFIMPDFEVDNKPESELLKDWDDFHGEITEDAPNFIRLVMDFYKPVIDPEAPVPDLLSL
jgi:hypothetical protein